MRAERNCPLKQPLMRVQLEAVAETAAEALTEEVAKVMEAAVEAAALIMCIATHGRLVVTQELQSAHVEQQVLQKNMSQVCGDILIEEPQKNYLAM